MSGQWQDNVADAFVEAGKLGIEVILGTGPGWTGSGGSWVAIYRKTFVFGHQTGPAAESDAELRGVRPARARWETRRPPAPQAGR